MIFCITFLLESKINDTVLIAWLGFFGLLESITWAVVAYHSWGCR